MNRQHIAALGIVLTLVGAAGVAQEAGSSDPAVMRAQAQTFDILIRRGRVYDGSGNPWRRADIGIIGDRIVAIGSLAGATGKVTVDARDRAVAPGFMDVHSHALDGLRRAELRDGRPLIAQGI